MLSICRLGLVKSCGYEALLLIHLFVAPFSGISHSHSKNLIKGGLSRGGGGVGMEMGGGAVDVLRRGNRYGCGGYVASNLACKLNVDVCQGPLRVMGTVAILGTAGWRFFLGTSALQFQTSPHKNDHRYWAWTWTLHREGENVWFETQGGKWCRSEGFGCITGRVPSPPSLTCPVIVH